MEPVGKAVAEQEQQVLKALFEQASRKPTRRAEQKQLFKPQRRERLSLERDGIMERLRRGSVEMEVGEEKRKGDGYRDLKVGTLFEAERGPERSALAKDGLG
jgi:hypothetical protein